MRNIRTGVKVSAALASLLIASTASAVTYTGVPADVGRATNLFGTNGWRAATVSGVVGAMGMLCSSPCTLNQWHTYAVPVQAAHGDNGTVWGYAS